MPMQQSNQYAQTYIYAHAQVPSSAPELSPLDDTMPPTLLILCIHIMSRYQTILFGIAKEPYKRSLRFEDVYIYKYIDIQIYKYIDIYRLTDTGLFCRRALFAKEPLFLQGSFATETYMFREPKRGKKGGREGGREGGGRREGSKNNLPYHHSRRRCTCRQSNSTCRQHTRSWTRMGRTCKRLKARQCPRCCMQ